MKSIKGLDTAHPYSRKATQMKRVIQREAFMNEKTRVRQGPKKQVLSKIEYFQAKVKDCTVISLEQCHELIKSFINRHSEEIAELVASVRKNRSKPNRLVLLENLREAETAEYEAGFEIPDIIDREGLQKLQKFCGHYNARDSLPMRRIRKGDLKIDISEQ